jgi:hypothetical protein
MQQPFLSLHFLRLEEEKGQQRKSTIFVAKIGKNFTKNLFTSDRGKDIMKIIYKFFR